MSFLQKKTAKAKALAVGIMNICRSYYADFSRNVNSGKWLFLR